MWNAKKTNVTVESGVFVVTLEFTNGTDTFSEIIKSRFVDDTFVSDYVAKRIGELTKIDKLATDLRTVTDITPTPVVSDTKTPQEKAKADYLYHFNRYRALVRASELGIIDSKDATLASEKDYCVTNFSVDFIDTIAF